MEKNSLNQKMNYQELTDSEMGFFEIDFWDFTNKIDYELTDYQQKILGKHGKLSLDFTNVINNNIKEEFKYYWFHKIYRSGWKETNLIIYRSDFKENACHYGYAKTFPAPYGLSMACEYDMYQVIRGSASNTMPRS